MSAAAVCRPATRVCSATLMAIVSRQPALTKAIQICVASASSQNARKARGARTKVNVRHRLTSAIRARKVTVANAFLCVSREPHAMTMAVVFPINLTARMANG